MESNAIHIKRKTLVDKQRQVHTLRAIFVFYTWYNN